MSKGGFVRQGNVGRVRKNQVTQEQRHDAQECLGARIGKYVVNRSKGMGHVTALEEARKP